MKVVGADGMTVGELNIALQLGAKFVIFEYCVSVVVMTFKRPSDIYLIRPGESAALKGLPYTLLSLASAGGRFLGVPSTPSRR